MSDGLTSAELRVIAHLTTAARAFFALPEHHPSERAEFAADMHHLQERVMARAAVRAHPEIFTPMVPTPLDDARTLERVRNVAIR